MTTRRELLTQLTAAGAVLGMNPLGSTALGATLRVGRPAPPATLVTLDGASISTEALTGEVVILIFWATWCVPCRNELPLLSHYLDEHANAGLQILGFSLDTPDKVEDVRAVAATVSFPVGLIANSNAADYGRIWRLPASFLIDRAGRLASDGWKEKSLAWTRQRLAEVVTPLLAT